MRAKLEQYLPRIGNGIENNESIHISQALLNHYANDEESVIQLITTVYPNFNIFSKNNYSLRNRAIVNTKNDFVDEIIQKLMHEFSGTPFDYLNRDNYLNSSL